MENLIDVLEDGGKDAIPIFRDVTSSLVKSHPERLLKVRDQKKSNACVPFVVTASMYGEEVLRSGRSIEGSPQELHDHIFFYRRPKVEGVPPVGPFNVPEKGFPSPFHGVFSYVISNGVSPAHLYPWVNGPSRFSLCSGGPWNRKVTNRDRIPIEKKQKIFIESYRPVLSEEENDILENMKFPGTQEYEKLNSLLREQPLTGCIPVTKNFVKWNTDEVYKVFPCEKVLGKHAVTLVGYGRDGNDEYFIIQNSWGPKWGVRGYAKVWRNLVERIYVPEKTESPTQAGRDKRSAPDKGDEQDDMGQSTKKQHI